MKIAVTGGGGFIGSALIEFLTDHGHEVVSPVRSLSVRDRKRVSITLVRDALSSEDWRAAIGPSVDCVVHLVGRAHRLGDNEDAFDLYWHDNVLVTRALIGAFGANEAPRLVYMSSVKAASEATYGTPISGDSPSAPTTLYGITKRATELELIDWAVGTDRRLTILRPPLVYGPHVRGNFLKLLGAADSDTPLPLGAIRNRRSLIFLPNLLRAVDRAMLSDRSDPVCVPLADAQPVSTRDLVASLRDGLGRPRRLIPVPPLLLRASLGVLGRSDQASRLVNDLEVDNGAAERLLRWRPTFATREGLLATAKWYAQVRDRPRIRRRNTLHRHSR